MRIGIFGGSFNPPHNMHKQIALDLISKNYLDKVIYVPTGNRYLKKELIDAKHRFEMLKIMIENYAQLSVSDYELDDSLTYTYQTLDYFRSIYPGDEIYFICGSDNLKEIRTWKNYEYILNNFKIIVIRRNDDDIDEILKYLNNKNIIITDINPVCISSTKIRTILRNNCEHKDLDEAVLRYIKNNKLYC